MGFVRMGNFDGWRARVWIKVIATADDFEHAPSHHLNGVVSTVGADVGIGVGGDDVGA